MIGRLILMRYETLERVGESAFFQVLKARDKTTGRIVAIKTLQSAFAHNPDFCEALRKALPPFTALSHPNIARIDEVAEEDGVPFLVTEFVRGINLKERIRRIAPFTLSVAVDFAIAIGEALQHAHAQGLIHGDLRPQNVIVSPEGAVKVTDFGLAQAFAASQDAAAANLGRAAAYLAPEVASGRPASGGSDLYALGAVLFEMLTGTTPYTGDTPLSILLRHQNDPIPSLTTLNPGVPRSLEGIVTKSLLKRPEDRYRSATEMLSDLKAVRDALRFGKPLSWSPLEGSAPVSSSSLGASIPSESPGESARSIRLPAPLPATPTVAPMPPPSTPPEAETVGAVRMSSTTTGDDRISPYLKAALYAVVFILFAGGIGLTAFWMAYVAKVPEQKFPELKGMKIEDARRAADTASVRLMVHEEYKDNVADGVIYQVDQVNGRIRPGRSINVWVSKGSRFVNVPDLTNVHKDDAEKKVREAGLAIGNVNREYSAKIPFDYVINQNPRARKRIPRDTAISLSISDGPKPDEEPTDSNTIPPDGTNAGMGNNGTGSPSSGTSSGVGNSTTNGTTSSGTTDQDLKSHRTRLYKKITRDNLGSRRVRFEYDDSLGKHVAIDEMHDEGDEVEVYVDSYGPKITVRVYYGDGDRPISENSRTFKKDE